MDQDDDLDAACVVQFSSRAVAASLNREIVFMVRISVLKFVAFVPNFLCALTRSLCTAGLLVKWKPDSLGCNESQPCELLCYGHTVKRLVCPPTIRL